MTITIPQRKHKYHAQPTTVDGIRFASKAEARRYGELKLLQKAGMITGLTLQPKYQLQEKFRHQGVMHRAIIYVADFRYRENGQVVVEDVKGHQTPVFKIKWKMFCYLYSNIDARIVKA